MEKLIAECESLLRLGQSAGVAHELQALNLAKVPRAQRLPLANICRRAGLFGMGLRLLTPLIHPDRKGSENPPSSEETAEYAALLMKIGSVREALALLRQLDTPEALLYSGFCHMNRWEYTEAAGLLRRYLRTASGTYLGLVASVNLCAALVHSGSAEAGELVAASLADAESKGYSRLQANLLELRAHLALGANRDEDCARDIAAALDLIGGQNTNDQLYLLKWRAVLDSRRSGSPEPLRDFRRLAESRRDWECVREADLQLLKLKFSQDRFDYLYAGTPWLSFRQRMLREIPGSQPSPAPFILGPAEAPRIDMLTAAMPDGQDMDCGKKVFRLLESLLLDFYAPSRLGAMFAHIFPEDHYHILHSPNRVHQLLWRTRSWLKANQVPAAIVEDDGVFALKLQGNMAFALDPDRATQVSHEDDLPLKILRGSLPAEFSSVEAQSVLKASEPTVRRLIQRLMTSGRVARIRSGRKVSYKIVA